MARSSTDPRAEYPDYMHTSSLDHAVNASSTIIALFQEVSDLTPNAGPLSQVLGITGQLLDIVKQIKTNKESCEFLVDRILRFLRSIAKACKHLTAPITAGSPTAETLNDLISTVNQSLIKQTLISKIVQIKTDAEAWLARSLWDNFWYRGPMKDAIEKHDKNLNDCLSLFLVSIMLQLGVKADTISQDMDALGGTNYSFYHHCYFAHIPTDFGPGHLFRNLVVSDAAHDSNVARDGCLKGTREAAITKFFEWVRNGTTPLCWLSGPAGYGKSAISQTIVEHCAADGTLAASFFFLRSAGARSAFSRVITTLAYQLTLNFPDTKPAIESALRSDPRMPSLSIRDQLEKLVITPLLARAEGSSTPIVFVVDALDECNDKQAMRNFILALASASTGSQLLVKWLLTSRGEEHIRQSFEDEIPRVVTTSLRLEEFNASSDIKLFLEDRFSNIIRQNTALFRSVPRPWPSPDNLEALVVKSDGLFIFAATLAKFITDGNGSPNSKLKTVLAMHDGLDPLYTQVLGAVSPKITSFRRVLTTLMLCYEQPSVAVLSKILELDADNVLFALMAIQSIIHIPSNDNDPIRLNHTSLRDFLIDRKRSEHHCINPSAFHTVLATDCVELLQKGLADLPRSGLLEDEAVAYASLHWYRHVEDSDSVTKAAPKLLSGLQNFFSSQQLIESWINDVMTRDIYNVTTGVLIIINSKCKVR
ncbi:hypothetical protein HWV62_34777 [Athelia sp. TMB]|nr:hypothetical protein HWV62_34777 [Athelia sp. TMB]